MNRCGCEDICTPKVCTHKGQGFCSLKAMSATPEGDSRMELDKEGLNLSARMSLVLQSS
jgi:hypothetical protein